MRRSKRRRLCRERQRERDEILAALRRRQRQADACPAAWAHVTIAPAVRCPYCGQKVA